jgi:hypothetical protein
LTKSSYDTEVIPLGDKPNEENLVTWISTALRRTGDEVTNVVILVDDQNVDVLVEALKSLKIPIHITTLTILSEHMKPYLTLVETFGL